MKKRLIIGIVLLLFAGISGSMAQELNSAPEKETRIEQVVPRSYSDSLNVEKTKAIRDKVEGYIDRTMTRIPHRNFWDRAILVFHNGFYKLVKTILPTRWHDYALEVIDIIFAIPLLVMLLILSGVFIINVVIVSLVLIIVSFFKRGREAYKEQMNQKLEDLFTQFLFYDLPEEEIVSELQKINSELGRTILIDIFINYQRNLSGEYRDRILGLYDKLQLYKISEKRTRSLHTYKRVKGIRELANMYPTGAREFILRYVTDKNDRVRSEAQIAYAYLDKDASFDFLDSLEQRLSTWAQLNILNHVKLHERNVPSFSKWVNSPNPDVENFSIRMMDYFQQNENAEQIIEKLNNPSEVTRNNVYKAIRHLNLLEAKEPVKQRYAEETYENKIEILRILADFGDESDLDFLKSLLSESGTQLKKLVCKAIYQLGPVGRDFLTEQSETDNVELHNFIEHIKDQRN